MQDLVGIVRQEQEMLQALERIRELKACQRAGQRGWATGNTMPGWHTALDLHNLLTVSEIVTRAALERKESRGAHFRDDFPDQGRAVRRSSTSWCERALMEKCSLRASPSRRCERICSRSSRR